MPLNELVSGFSSLPSARCVICTCASTSSPRLCSPRTSARSWCAGSPLDGDARAGSGANTLIGACPKLSSRVRRAEAWIGCKTTVVAPVFTMCSAFSRTASYVPGKSFGIERRDGTSPSERGPAASLPKLATKLRCPVKSETFSSYITSIEGVRRRRGLEHRASRGTYTANAFASSPFMTSASEPISFGGVVCSSANGPK
mmetsp:Transcript_1280/g.5202  ORF Transcript_1280/g.5202 Transcript_1280/m.5202 type:complete len:200 (-) Transcript_1280:478-1077(-)